MRRAVLAAVGAMEFLFAALLYFRPADAFALLGRHLLDPVIGRQYALTLLSVALFYGILATNPSRYRRLIWIGIAQRLAEIVVAVIDWRAGALSTSSFAVLSLIEVAVGVLLTLCTLGEPARDVARQPYSRASRRLARALWAFGGLEVFWFLLSTIAVQIGARLLSWKLQDAYTTQQQGIALLVIGLVSLATASDVHRYRTFVYVPVASQAVGIVNAIVELRLGTIPIAVALLQWAIEGFIVAGMLRLAAAGDRERLRLTAAIAPVV